ncbi:hypothetical protein [Streptomyces sp. H27-D2]|uniref:hypothetical protein n=1 Tax=Streptomyces sp. H27-D2 TaxID=3046304 RepID=UPI002DBA5E22|nr:hypothetical protein [Streptomyces sp. H27-D2]MEC4015023.1 hypothetical protein [Streptomyces sp. H27-D2]
MLNVPDTHGPALHALRVAGWLEADRLSLWQVTEPLETITRLIESGHVRQVRSPRGEMYGLTPAGTERATSLAAGWLGESTRAERAALTAALAGFEAHDSTLKQLVTAYQRGAIEAVAEQLRELHDRARDALNAVGSAIPLWESYPARLENAALRVEKGELGYLASPLLESYHTVWHVAHRDMRLVCEELNTS